MAKKERDRIANISARRVAAESETVSRQAQDRHLRRLTAAVRNDPQDLDATLELGEYYLNDGMGERLLESVLHLESSYPFPDRLVRVRYNRLLTFGLIEQHKLNEAEYVAERGLRDCPDCADFHAALCCINTKLHAPDEAIEAGTRFLQSGGKATAKRLASVQGINYRLLNALGRAYSQAERFGEAVKCFEQAVSLRPDDPVAYISLANLYRQTDRAENARQVVDTGIQHCREVQELKMLRTVLVNTARVSACMIVKDEEDMLGRCLESIRDWVHEIVIVDTGSSDRTVEIAESYGARVFHQPWEGNFSKHRNYSIEQATGDWIFIIDADEQFCVRDTAKLIPSLNDDRFKVLSINVTNVYGANDEREVFLPSPRFFRRDLNLRYEGIVHNQLIVPDEIQVARVDVGLKHYGYDLSPEKMAQKTERSKKLLENQLAYNPDDAFALFNYAQLLRSQTDRPVAEYADTIIRCAAQAASLTDPSDPRERHIHLMALDQLAWTHFFAGNPERALNYCRRALRLKPDYLDPLLLLAHISFKKRQYEEAEAQYRRYLDVQAKYDPSKETDNLILLHVDNRVAATCNLGLIAYLSGNFEQSRGWLHKCLQLNPEYGDANALMGKLSLQDGNIREACDYFNRQIETGHGTGDAALSLAQVHLSTGNREEGERLLGLAEQSRPKSAGLLLRLIRVHAEVGNTDAASRLMDDAAEMIGEDPEERILWAETLDLMGRHEDAIDVYSKLVSERPQDGELINDLANCYYRSERFAEAEEQYLRALAADMPPAVAYRNLGLARAQLGKVDEAIISLEHYLQLDPDAVEIAHVVADLYAKGERFGEAIGYYERVLRVQSRDTGALFGLSECYLHMGHRDSAILGYRRVLKQDEDFEPAAKRLRELSGMSVSDRQ
jgi:tetratricopeptide (TPR) repeat protein